MAAADPLDFLAGGGLMERRIRAHDWAATPLGSPETWPQSLKTALKIALNSRYPIWMGWGKELTKLYNDPYIPVLGKRDEWSLGASAKDVWKEVWVEHLGPQADAVMLRGEASWNDQRQMVMYRNGYAEETYFTFSFSPLPADNGGIGGLFCACTEDTQRVLGERRLAVLSGLAAATAHAKTEQEAAASIRATLRRHDDDVSFSILYLLSADGTSARRVGSNGSSPQWADDVIAINPSEPTTSAWPLARSMRDGLVILRDLRIGLPGGRWPEATTTAVVVPLAKAGHTQPRGFLVAGASPRLPFDDRYASFFELLGRGAADALSNARAFEEEKQRAEALAELDRAKTKFFSNVSHEFRTPLTLILGPVEDMLANSFTGLAPATKGQLEVVHRNSLRLLKLVNTMLDFSRIEAGRMQASYERTDLPLLTADLASLFRSACERAGVQLIVSCPPLPDGAATYVDRDLWEKIVLNLLSNAFKFTLEGEIEVALNVVGERAELSVRDTGTGIPSEEMPRLFERFHRVPNARGRTHEGTGIGLALVSELVKLHGGTVSAQSTLGRGSRFTVSIPLGATHLDPAHLHRSHDMASTRTGAKAYVEEIMRWLPDAPQGISSIERDWIGDVLVPTHPVERGGWAKPRILWADDNADMRDYVMRLLQERFVVEAVPDGAAALTAARARPPDLILSDVMMPMLDGFGLISEVRADPVLASTPVILLSARAGEEARIEGAEAGADDYLTKPFSARELLARVEAHLRMARLRREINDQLRVSEARFRNMADHAPVMIWVTDATGSCTFLSRSWCDFTGQTPATGLGFGWLDAVHPDDREAARQTFMNASAKEQAFRLEYRLRRTTGEYVWCIDAAGPRHSEDGTFAGYIGSVIDITERKLAEQTQKLLVDELNHRVKNMLSVIQAIASQTLRESADPTAFTVSFKARLAALSRAHGVLTDGLWKRVSLQDIVAAALVPFRAQDRFVIRAPATAIEVAPNAAVTISLMLHELATNASKYGALSTPTGRIDIVLSGQPSLNDADGLSLEWRESRGPRVERPSRNGFGSRLIAASAAQLGGEVALAYDPDGFSFAFRIPAASLDMLDGADPTPNRLTDLRPRNDGSHPRAAAPPMSVD